MDILSSNFQSPSEALKNEDILGLIFQHFDLEPGSQTEAQSRKDLFSAAKTCQAFVEPALDSLWSILPSLLPLLLLTLRRNRQLSLCKFYLIGTSSISGSSRTQKYVREIQGSKNQSSHRCFRIRLRNSPLHRGTLLRCRDDRWFIFRQILPQVIVKKFAPSDLILIAHLRLRLRNLRFPRNEERAPRETSGGHGCQ